VAIFRSSPNAMAAAFVSAAGSLPQHMMALLVALAIHDGLATVGRAGWISTAFTVGLLTGSVGLPAAGVTRITKVGALALLVASICSLAFSLIPIFELTLIAWCFVGVACGGLNLLMSLFAAKREDRRSVLRLRLGIVLLASSSVFAVAHFAGALSTYASAVLALLCAFGLITVGAAPQYDGSVGRSSPGAPQSISVGERGAWPSLLLVAAFFVGQPGYTAYAAHIATANGVSLLALPAIYAGCKFAAACALLGPSSSGSDSPKFLLSIGLSAAIGVMAAASTAWAFACGLLLWELCVNLQSTRFQSAVLGTFPRSGGRWLSASIAIGAAAGPAIHGWAISIGAGLFFAIFSALTAFLPMVWIIHARRLARRTRPDLGPKSLASG